MTEEASGVWGIMLPWLSLTGAVMWLFLLAALGLRVHKMLRARGREDVTGRWLVVTGCDSGFGHGVVESLVARGANVIAFCLTAQGADAARSLGAKLAPCLDLTDDEAVVDASREVMSACEGELWGLVHNAGVVLPGFVDYQPISFYRTVMDVNFFAPVLLTQRLLEPLRKGRGRVVLVSSVDGLVSLPGNAPYDASKFAMEAYADALRVELSFWNVHVSVVNPATMRTPLAMGFFEGHLKAWQAMERVDPDGAWKETYPKDWLDEYIAFNTQQLERIVQDPAHAIDDIMHALTAKRPRLRYLSGTLAKTLFYALWLGPESWSARFKRSMIQPAPRLCVVRPTSEEKV
ncbi:MAG: SDR family NAD(P)-dependent oxidoreductase [Pseudomonadales bacterium]|nr:SDR family NAD(P)-dependent oxidoreductase [Pseudomonadales bacterium]MDP6828999.1 SDR family NAD(P)-dependent oxidoreductase [Pseudomonadales bacterium]